MTSTISSAPCATGRIHDGLTRTSLSGTATCSPMASAVVMVTGQRSSPWVLRRHAGRLRALVHRPGGLVQPLARVHALRLEPLRDQAVEVVDPAVQRPDPVDDLGGRFFVSERRRAYFVVTHASHEHQTTRDIPKVSFSAEYPRSRRRPGRGPRPA